MPRTGSLVVGGMKEGVWCMSNVVIAPEFQFQKVVVEWAACIGYKIPLNAISILVTA